jgi:hypothetical protein
MTIEAGDRKAVEHYRTPKRGRHVEHIATRLRFGVRRCSAAFDAVRDLHQSSAAVLVFFPLRQGQGSLQPAFGIEHRIGRINR